MQADASLDAFGLMCPMPVYKTAQKIKELQIGQILEVLATDPGIKEDMPAWCRTTGNEMVSIEEKDGEYRVYVRKLKE